MRCRTYLYLTVYGRIYLKVPKPGKVHHTCIFALELPSAQQHHHHHHHHNNDNIRLHMADTTDPLAVLPAEIVLRILDFTAPAALAALTRVNWSWHYFIDQDHREAIYATKTEHPPAARDFAFLENSQSFAKYYGDVASWKDLCKRQTLLGRQWQRSAPVVSESIFQVGIDAIWRFKPDFQRRLVLSTSQAGGLCVTDMDASMSWD